jgi:3-keto-disaccharide hydrolase
MLMQRPRLAVAIAAAALAAISSAGAAQGTRAGEGGGWVNLFDGATLSGWNAAEHPDAWTVRDGTLSCNGERSHLFYVGPVEQAQFRDFEAEIEVRTHTGANSGVYFHTAWQDSGWPAQGFEMQVNNHQPHFAGDSGDAYIENKKTGSLYGIRNTYKALARDNEWFTLKLRVQGPRVRIHVNESLVVDYLEPDGDIAGLTPPLPKLGTGTFALQCHDGRSQVQYRRIAVHPLPPAPAGQTTRAPNPAPAAAQRYRLARDNFPLVDLRALDATDAGRLEASLAAARDGALFVGVSASAGRTRPITDDAAVDRLVERFGGRPLFLGLRADERGWATRISPKALSRIDFVLLDGETLAAALPAGAAANPDTYGDALVAATVSSLAAEPVDVYGAPLFVPAALAGRRDAIWTEARQQQVIDAAVAHHVAIEINGTLRLPGEAFVRRAKAAGATFTLGRCAVDTPAGDYCFGVREKTGLSWRNMYQPGHQPPRGASATPTPGVVP